MATKEEKELLIEILKFTPRTYRVELGNYGGEVYCGRVDRKVYDYFKEKKIDIEEYTNDWDSELNVPEEFQPFSPGSPYDCDDLVHANGATMDDGNIIEVYDENNDKVWECALNLNTLDDEGIECEEEDSFDSDNLADGEVVFWGAQGEKGLLFGGEFELNAPFDPKQLKLSYANADGWLICNGVEYNGEYIDNNDLSTTGKWGENKWLIGGGEEVYNPQDSWEVPKDGPSPDDWEKSPEFKFKKIKPVHQGWYRCNWGYGTTYGSLYWNGINFVEFNYGKEDVVADASIVYWQGYNWDTTDWDNRPPEPPDVVCDNKKCGWVGMGSDRIEDAEFNDHCPECNGTEFSWIEYDPETAKGRKNREKYCITKEEEVKFIAGLDNALAELTEVELPKGSWPF